VVPPRAWQWPWLLLPNAPLHDANAALAGVTWRSWLCLGGHSFRGAERGSAPVPQGSPAPAVSPVSSYAWYGILVNDSVVLRSKCIAVTPSSLRDSHVPANKLAGIICVFAARDRCATSAQTENDKCRCYCEVALSIIVDLFITFM